MQGLLGGTVMVFLLLFVTGISEHGVLKALLKALWTAGWIFVVCLIGYSIAGIL